MGGGRSVLGIDMSTQSVTGLLMDADSGETLWNHSLAYRYDPRLAGLGFEHDSMLIPPRESGEAEQPPRLFIAALEALLSDLAASGQDLGAIAAINASGQQHGHVYLNARADAAFGRLRQAESANQGLPDILAGVFAYGGAPIWKTANTQAEAEAMRRAAGGREEIIRRSGSDIPLRFSACSHRRLALRHPEAYAATARIMQISSLVPAILAGDSGIALDFGNACGTGLMNYASRTWDPVLLAAAADDLPGGTAALAAKLPPLAHPLAVVGKAAARFCARYGISPECRILAGSGDNPQSKVLSEGSMLSLGTSFVYMMSSPQGGVDGSGAANAMYDGLGRPFNFACRTNGALAWDGLRVRHGLDARDYAASEAALDSARPGSVVRFWQPEKESFPLSPASPEPVRIDSGPADFPSDYAAAVDSALGLIYRYGSKITGPADNGPLSVCGGPTASPGILRRIASIWNRPVIMAGSAGAALGAALAAAVALEPEEGRGRAAEGLRRAMSAGRGITQPDPEMVLAYHAPGRFLDSLELAFEGWRRRA